MELYQLHYFVEVARNRNFTHSAPKGHPEVFEVAVVGVPHEKLGETAKALVVLKKDRHVKGRQLIAYCSEHLARFKCPSAIAFVTALPKTFPISGCPFSCSERKTGKRSSGGKPSLFAIW